MRAAMYAEMAKAAAGRRPPLDREDEWDAAFEAAIRFIRTCRLGEEASRQLLSEASTTRRAGTRDRWTAPADETCMRLAVEFRRRIRRQGGPSRGGTPASSSG